LVYRSADGLEVKPFWLTPLHHRTEYNHNLPRFGGQDFQRRLQSLVTQLMHEEKTVAYLDRKLPGGGRHPGTYGYPGLTGNPHFAEWLMGYPRDWTLVVPDSS
jgi:hypothetical protein